MKKTNTILLLICALFINTSTFAQDHNLWVVLDQQVQNESTTVINHQGKATWSLPAGHKPQTDQKNDPINIKGLFESYSTYDFEHGPLAVRSVDGWYLIDHTGKKIKDFGKTYKTLTAPMGGFYRAYEQHPVRRGASNIVYLDLQGNEAFSGKRFWEATAFNEGLALVQETDEKGRWLIINTKGETVVPLEAGLSSKMYQANEFQNGLALVTFNKMGNYKKVYINTQGAQAISPMDIAKSPSPQAMNFRHGIGVVTADDKYYFLDTSGKLIGKFDLLLSVYDITKELIHVNNGQYINNLFDHQLKPVKPALKPNEIFICEMTNDGYFGGVVIDTVTDKRLFYIFDATTKAPLYHTEKYACVAENDRIIVAEVHQFDKKLKYILNLKGEKLYEIPVHDRVFWSIADALPYSNDVRHLNLSEGDQLDQIGKFTQLKTLELSDLKETTLPAGFGKLQQLSSLKITDCNELKYLPAAFMKLKQLRTLSVTDCRSLTGLENIINALPDLEKVNTQNYTFEEGYIKNIKSTRPALEISNWVSTGIIHSTID